MGGTIGAPTTDRPIVHATIPFTVFSPLLFSMTFVAGRAISERWGLSILLYQSRFKDDFSIDFPSICLYLSFFLSVGECGTSRCQRQVPLCISHDPVQQIFCGGLKGVRNGLCHDGLGCGQQLGQLLIAV